MKYILIAVIILISSLESNCQTTIKLKFDSLSKKYEHVDTFNLNGFQAKNAYNNIKNNLLTMQKPSDVIYVGKAIEDQKNLSLEYLCLFKPILSPTYVRCKMFIYVQKTYVQYYFTDFFVINDDGQYPFEINKTMLDKYKIFDEADINMQLLAIMLKAFYKK